MTLLGITDPEALAASVPPCTLLDLVALADSWLQRRPDDEQAPRETIAPLPPAADEPARG
jgi:predicted acyltransferase